MNKEQREEYEQMIAEDLVKADCDLSRHIEDSIHECDDYDDYDDYYDEVDNGYWRR